MIFTQTSSCSGSQVFTVNLQRCAHHILACCSHWAETTHTVWRTGLNISPGIFASVYYSMHYENRQPACFLKPDGFCFDWEMLRSYSTNTRHCLTAALLYVMLMYSLAPPNKHVIGTQTSTHINPINVQKACLIFAHSVQTTLLDLLARFHYSLMS